MALIDTWDYNREHDFILFSSKDRDDADYKCSLNCDDTIFDVNKTGHINGVVILNASQRLGIPKESFKDVEYFNVFIEVIDDNNIKLMIKSKLQTQPNRGGAYECQVRSKFKK